MAEMTPERRKLLARIKKLLATNGRSEQEVTTFTEHAQKLIEKYNVDNAELIEAELKAGDGLIEKEALRTLNAEFELWEVLLYTCMNVLFEIMILIDTSRSYVDPKTGKPTDYESARVEGDDDDEDSAVIIIGADKQEYRFKEAPKMDKYRTLVFAGYDTDVECAVSMFQFLHSSLKSMSEDTYSKMLDPSNDESLSILMLREVDELRTRASIDPVGAKETYVRSYCYGVASRVSDRMDELFKVDKPKGALVPLKQAKLNEKYGNMTAYKHDKRKEIIRAFHAKGLRDGDKVELQRRLSASGE